MLAAALSISVFSGCGEDGDENSDERSIRESTSMYLTGIAEGDSEVVCGVLSTGELLRIAATTDGSVEDLVGTCVAESPQQPPFDAELLSKAVAEVDSAELLLKDDAAVIHVPTGGFAGKDAAVIKLVREGESWTVDGLQ